MSEWFTFTNSSVVVAQRELITVNLDRADAVIWHTDGTAQLWGPGRSWSLDSEDTLELMRVLRKRLEQRSHDHERDGDSEGDGGDAGLGEAIAAHGGESTP